MKAYVQTACLLGFTAFSMVSGQSGLGLASLPDCAKPCAANLPAQCGKVDFKCICGSSDWISGISCCVFKACSPADQQKTIDIANQLCSVVGVTLPTVATCPSSTIAAPASTPSTTPKATSSLGPASSAASKQSSSSSVTAGQNSANTATSTTTGSSALPATSNLSTTSATAVFTGVAGHLVGHGIGAAGVAALALALI